MLSKQQAAPASSGRAPRTHRRAQVVVVASLPPSCGRPSSAPSNCASHSHHLLPAAPPPLASTACQAAPAAMEAATVATQLQGAPLPAAPHLAPAPHLRLAKAVKAQRKQLERSSRRRQSCGPLSFVQDDVRGAEAASAVVDQLLDQLRRLELHQVAPQGDGCTTLPLAAAAAATAAAPQQQQQQQSMVRLRAVIDGDGGDPWEAGVDLSSELFAPRSYQVPGRVLVCQGSKCRAKGALGVLQAVSAVAAGSDSAVQVLPCKCLGKCKEGAVMRVKQEGVAKCAVYTQLQAELVPSVLDSHFLAPVAAASPEAGVAAAADACCTDCHTTAPAAVAAAMA